MDILAWVSRNIELELEIKFLSFIGKWNIRTTIKKRRSEAGEKEKRIIDCKFLSLPELKTHTHTHMHTHTHTCTRTHTHTHTQLTSQAYRSSSSAHSTSTVQFSSVQLLSHVRLFATPWIAAHQLPEFTHTRVHRVSDAIQPSHLLLSHSSAANPSQHQSLFQWVNSSHEVAKVLVFQL